MSQVYGPATSPVMSGGVSTPPPVRLPDPASLFRRRAERLRALSAGHQLEPYLAFLADLAAAQDRVKPVQPAPVLPAADELRRSREFRMPALDRSRLAREPAVSDTVDGIVARLESATMPEAARAALAVVSATGPVERAQMAQAVLDNAVPFEEVAEHVLVAAALQVVAACVAGALPVGALTTLEECLCPVCGSAPVSSSVVGWHGAHGARYCTCSLCSTSWNYVRVRCTACGGTEGIAYQEIEGGPDTIKAESCDTCRSYLKVFHEVKDPALDPVADDVGSLALDLLVAEAGYRRSGVNPLLTGY
ncbi:formate dehydrogenase accessory protein FdhE [Enterovirga aerilata]|uniref:Protein FdhE homolog n=1 Tax=Enterovirga aerilata TaxID=2730920 RepID=A0A849IEY7_9HYPH|nr:formate dehydrogenase accessory protein FdhE [Enterovirga sp. DB1703]NNM72443.1 formate dehydrogenase accessory protein FdhE [Enterovirga sp. DB1703]